MKVIVGKRGSGKTKKLIEISARTGDHIVCKDRQLAKVIATMAADMNLMIPFPLTFDEFLNHGWSRKEIRGFLIDDLDALLFGMLGYQELIHAVTLTEGNYFEKENENELSRTNEN